MPLLEMIGRRLALYLARPGRREIHFRTCKPEQLAATLRKGDVLLVEGSSHFSTAVKYLTQSTWSHAALCVEDGPDAGTSGLDGHAVLEAHIVEGVRVVPLSAYWGLNTRICRPAGLAPEEIDAVVAYAMSRVGQHYDLKNLIDLSRYLISTPPVPTRWRRRMLALGSGDPTRAICSSLIAQAFHSIRFPILPDIVIVKSDDPECVDCYNEILHIRHHSLFVPRDFDISPYFQIINPTLENGFDFHDLNLADDHADAEARPDRI